MDDMKESLKLLGLRRDLQNKIENAVLKQVALPALFFPDNASLPVCPAQAVKQNPASILMPLTVYPHHDGTFRILDGVKRFMYCKDIVYTHCHCQIIAGPILEETIPALRAMLNCHRQLSLAEQFLFVGWCSAFVQENDFYDSCQSVGIDRKKASLLADLRKCDDKTISSVFSNAIHLENADGFQRLPQTDKNEFTDFFSSMQLSVQMQRDILDWLTDIGFTRSQTIAMVLSDPVLLELRNNSMLTLPQRIQKIHETIFSWRFPEYYKIHNEWKQKMRKTLGKTHGVLITPNPYFEKNKLEIKITLTKGEQGKPVFEKLTSIPADTWTSLICPIA